MRGDYERNDHLYQASNFKKEGEFIIYNDFSINMRLKCPPYVESSKEMKSKETPPTFQNAMKVPILIGQCFGLFPVIGFSGNDTSKLRFTIKSARFIYSTLSTCGQSLITMFLLLKMFMSDSSFGANSSVIFYGTTCIIGMLFFHMATIWPSLCQHIAKTEAVDPMKDKTVIKKCQVACILVLVLAALEHILAIISGLAIVIDCQPDTPLYDAVMLDNFAFLWTFMPYHPVLGFFAKFINVQCTFNWNFGDAFVICISIYLTSRLQQISNRIIAIRGKFAPEEFWRTLREDYSRLIHLIRKIDDAVNGVIFVSFAMNLFIICMQLLHALEPMKGYEQAVYFIYSFSFLLVRSLAVSLIASRVHTASKSPAEYLYDVPSSAYCYEVQRLLNQIHGDVTALTGLQFFNVKRGLVLTITGTIITYELVLMQFAGVTPTMEPTTVTTPTVSTSYFNGNFRNLTIV